MRTCRSRRRRAHISRRWNARPTIDQTGSSTVELVILAPVLVAVILLVVYAGRLTQANALVQHAADQAARAVSMSHAQGADATAKRIVRADLSDNGSACGDVQVEVTTTRADVTVRVWCSVDRSSLAPLVPGAQTVAGSSTEVLDRYRGGDA